MVLHILLVSTCKINVLNNIPFLVIVAADDDHVMNATSDLETWQVLFTTDAGIGFVGASAFITGWILDGVLVVIVVCSMPFVRRSGHFEVS